LSNAPQRRPHRRDRTRPNDPTTHHLRRTHRRIPTRRLTHPPLTTARSHQRRTRQRRAQQHPRGSQPHAHNRDRRLLGTYTVDPFFNYDPFHDAVAAKIRRVPVASATIPILSAEHLTVCKVVFDRPKDWVDIAAMREAGTHLDALEILRWVQRIVGDDDECCARGSGQPHCGTGSGSGGGSGTGGGTGGSGRGTGGSGSGIGGWGGGTGGCSRLSAASAQRHRHRKGIAAEIPLAALTSRCCATRILRYRAEGQGRSHCRFLCWGRGRLVAGCRLPRKVTTSWVSRCGRSLSSKGERARTSTPRGSCSTRLVASSKGWMRSLR
jgi:hypothetical protein